MLQFTFEWYGHEGKLADSLMVTTIGIFNKFAIMILTTLRTKQKIETMKNYLMCFALLMTMAMMTSCGEDETCSDGIQNGDETSIDCGGPDCDACPTCTDGIQNGTETGVDCGGDCDVCPSCDDGIQNGTETGVDCGGECAACVTSVAEDKANIQRTFDDLLMCTQDIKDSRAVTVLFKNFLNMSDGEALNEDWIEDMTEDLEGVVDFEHIEDNSRFDLSYHAGTHIFNGISQTWLKTNNVSDKMIFQFPSEPNLMGNDAELIIDMYEDKQVTIDGETMFLPTAMHAVMNVDFEKVFEITISKVTYADNAGYQLPVELNAQLFMDPMEMDIEVTRVSTTEYEMGMNFSDGKLCDIRVNAQMELEDDDFENFSEDGFDKIAVQVNVGQLSIRTLGDVAGLFGLDDDPTETQINAGLDLDMFFEDIKIADLEINEDMETVLIFYKDGTFEDSSVFYDGFWNDVSSLWSEFFG